MSRSWDDLDLFDKMQERGYSREQVTMWLEVTDAMVTVAQRGATLVKRLLPLASGRGR